MKKYQWNKKKFRRNISTMVGILFLLIGILIAIGWGLVQTGILFPTPLAAIFSYAIIFSSASLLTGIIAISEKSNG